MDTLKKVEVLGQSAQYDLCGECGSASRVRDDIGRWIYPAVLPDGKTVKLLKILQSNACQKDCLYCPTRRGRDFRRIAFQPQELARLFDELHRRRLVQGLFLSSAVWGNPDHAMERIIATAEILRARYEFRGYIHLKIMPGASSAAVERAMELATRVSINLEAPNQERLARLAPGKDFEAELLAPLWRAKEIAQERGLAPAGLTTQFVVGPAGESDQELLSTTQRLYQEFGLARVYFSAFQPVPDTPLENHPPTPPLREHRLYQSDFLFRKYGFTIDELIFDAQGNLPMELDPKTLWAVSHPERFPVEVNRARKEELLRVPGIGPRSAARIVRLRRQGSFRSLGDLRRIGVVIRWAAPFILLDGRRPPIQLSLWDSAPLEEAIPHG
ncbi:MAG: putative DNA modification/repair radical SAM protein [Anaerolineae bacterium]